MQMSVPRTAKVNSKPRHLVGCLLEHSVAWMVAAVEETNYRHQFICCCPEASSRGRPTTACRRLVPNVAVRH